MPNRVKVFPVDSQLSKARNLVERSFIEIKYFRAVAIRYKKRDGNTLASIQPAPIRIWLRSNERVTSRVSMKL